MEKEIYIPEVIAALLDEDHPFSPRYLHRFSDLIPVDIKALKSIWREILPERRVALLTDLEEINDHDTLVNFDNLAILALKDPLAEVRSSAIRLLDFSDDRRLVHLFIALMHSDPDEHVRAEAAFALSGFVLEGDLDQIPSTLYDELMTHLLAVINGMDSQLVKRRALEAASYSCRDELPPLIEKAYCIGTKDWIVTALFSMGRSLDPRWETRVLEQLQSEDEDILVDAVQAAGELELKSARQPLLDLLEKDIDNEDLHNAIYWSLSKIGGDTVRRILEEALDKAADDDETEFLEEALDNLAFTEDLPLKEILDVKPPKKKDLDHVINLEDEIEEEEDLHEDL